MKKHFITFLILVFALPTIMADEIYYNITQENSVSQIETDLQTVINNATSNDMVVVTGSKTNADITLTLNIPAGKIVVWEATYHSIGVLGKNSLISFLGSGTFEMANGELISDTAEEIITSTGDEATIKVSGGTIAVKVGNTIVAVGKNPQVYVSGGYLSNDADDVYPVIVAFEANPSLQEALVHISGTAKVEAKGYGNAIISSGSVIISGDAQVSNTKGGSGYNQAAIQASLSVEVRDNAKVTASNNYTILSYGDVTVSGNSIIEAKENAIAIYIYGEGIVERFVNVQDKSQVIAANNYSISHNITYFHLTVSGGVVFAYGNDISHVVNDNIGITDSGVILAWNKDAGNTNYKIYSTEDIFVSPESATAYWDKKGSKFGISYTNGENTGFIPLEINVLSTIEPDFLNLIIYPNPTTGELRMENGELRMENVEFFDIYGRNLSPLTSHLLPLTPYPLPLTSYLSPLTSNLSPLTSIDISHFPVGLYFVKITTNAGVVVKKVVKE